METPPSWLFGPNHHLLMFASYAACLCLHVPTVECARLAKGRTWLDTPVFNMNTYAGATHFALL
ncbi:hypothetical protein PsYK624_121570 [Phanerochaete sordida]|uniref:Uncharacterized protein n=1 Tax=Phanerochaete sordida TaxID=48140 RepID=A0A9P3LIS0_9APHY|nr:hypothetical protein PsYK624_121570 [Phanerochaete sordida]